MSEAERQTSDIEAKELQPIPDFIKYGAMALVAVIIIAIILFIGSSGDDTKQRSLSDIEDPFQEKKPLEVSLTDSDPKKLHPVVGQRVRVSNELQLPFVTQKKDNDFEKQFKKLNQQLSQLVIDNDLRQQGQDALIQDLQSQLTAQTAKIEQLLNNAKASLAKATKVKTKSRKHSASYRVRPPFELVSVDQWGNDTYAVVRYQQHLHELSIGQSLKGWVVSDFGRYHREVMFKNKAGTIRKLLIKT